MNTDTMPGDFSHIEGWPENEMESIKCLDDERLLNAFQLVKNGKKISHLKFEEFKKLMENKYDHKGNMLTVDFE